ncbi:MAG: HXXEE domain-containing protein [Bacteroidota bacterium]
MKNERLLLGCTVLLFAILWLPFGQYPFLINHWVKIGVYAIPFIGIGLFAFRDHEHPFHSNPRFIALLMLIAYVVHQFEEHWIDLFGNVYAFYTFNNNFILSALGEPGSAVKPLTKESIFIINTSLVWLTGSLAILRSPKQLFPFFSMVGIILINGVVHILAGVATLTYNPGLLTSMLVFIPLCAWILKKTAHSTTYFKTLVVGGLIWAFFAHVIMVGGLLAANWFNLIPEYVYWAMLIAWSILPVAVFRDYKHNTEFPEQNTSLPV